MPYHTQHAIVHDNNNKGKSVADSGCQFVEVHAERTVSCEQNGALPVVSNTSTNRRTHAKSHGAEPAGGDEGTRRGKLVFLRRPHLMLADVGCDGGVLVSQFTNHPDHLLGRKPGILQGFLLPLHLFDLPVPILMPEGARFITEQPEHILNIPNKSCIGGDIFVDLSWVDINMQHFCIFCKFLFIACRAVAEPDADGHDQVSLRLGARGGILAVHTCHSQKTFIMIGYGGQAHHTKSHWRVDLFCKPQELLRSVGDHHASAAIKKRLFCRLDQANGFRKGIFVNCRIWLCIHRLDGLVIIFVDLDILGDVN